jgi:DNA relaxase NicK
MDRIVDGFIDFDVDSLDLSAVENFCPPSSNTGGNLVSPPQIPVFDHKSSQKCKIDYLSFSSTETVAELLHYAESFTVDLEAIDHGRGWQGYPRSAQLMQRGENIGLVAWGAPHGRNFISFSGAACKHWTDYHVELVQNMLLQVRGRITRIDYALDFYYGEVTYDDAEKALAAGEFQMKQGGRRPAVDRHASEGSYGNMGRTLYVGASKSSKRICIYEKGLEQFGKLPAKWLEDKTELDVVSYRIDGSVGCVGDVSVIDWLRAEVRYTNEDRDLDFDEYAMLFRRDEFFAGAYPFCARVLGMTDGVRPAMRLTETEAEIEKMKLNARNSYGSLIHSLTKLGYTPEQIVNALDSGFHSKRLVKAGYFNHLENVVPF